MAESKLTTVTVYPNKSSAMRAGNATPFNYKVEPVGEPDPAKPWRLVLDVDPSRRPTATGRL